MSGAVLPIVQSILQLANLCQFRIVNVVIESEYANSMKDLANAMDLMPNLHTVQIIAQGYHIRSRCSLSARRKVINIDQFLKAFGCHVYPSVRCAILPVQARAVLASLPAVVDVYINSPYCHYFPSFATALAANCPVESLGWEMDYGASAAGTSVHVIHYRVRSHTGYNSSRESSQHSQG